MIVALLLISLFHLLLIIWLMPSYLYDLKTPPSYGVYYSALRDISLIFFYISGLIMGLFYYFDKKRVDQYVRFNERRNEFMRLVLSPYYNIEKRDSLIVMTSGRYELVNKGFDLYIKALAKLNDELRGTGDAKQL